MPRAPLHTSADLTHSGTPTYSHLYPESGKGGLISAGKNKAPEDITFFSILPTPTGPCPPWLPPGWTQACQLPQARAAQMCERHHRALCLQLLMPTERRGDSTQALPGCTASPNPCSTTPTHSSRLLSHGGQGQAEEDRRKEGRAGDTRPQAWGAGNGVVGVKENSGPKVQSPVRRNPSRLQKKE